MSERVTIFSADRNGPDGRGEYRYTLWRDVRDLTTKHPDEFVMFIGLNPSTATETVDDPTIRRCMAFARSWGFGWLLMCNAFAFRATDPKVMKRHPSPIGPENDVHLLRLGCDAALIVAAWGKHATHLDRHAWLRDVLPARTVCLRKNKDGSPEHPLYIPANTTPIPLL